jgi:hypothetical protein
LRRNRGYPWPEDSYGMDPMFGPDGWCHSCGIPKVPQRGSIVLQRSTKSKFDGAWVPHWQYDAWCLSEQVTQAARERFDLGLMPVEWKGPGTGRAWQIVAPAAGETCFDSDALAAAAVAKHGEPGGSCPECGTWRWFPLDYQELPAVALPSTVDLDVFACPEWFGAGKQAYRQTLFRRPLAELLVEASPRDFKVVPANVSQRAWGTDRR